MQHLPDYIFAYFMQRFAIIVPPLPSHIRAIETLATSRNASDNSATTASMATSCPYRTCAAGNPRRVRALSIHGKSSIKSEAVCTISTEQARSSTAAAFPFSPSQASIINTDRVRFPGARTPVCMACARGFSSSVGKGNSSFSRFSIDPRSRPKVSGSVGCAKIFE